MPCPHLKTVSSILIVIASVYLGVNLCVDYCARAFKMFTFLMCGCRQRLKKSKSRLLSHMNHLFELVP